MWTEQSSGDLENGDWPDGVHSLGDARPTRFMAAFDPARVVGECDAKRRIIDIHESWKADNGETICFRCGHEHVADRAGGHYPCGTLRPGVAVTSAAGPVGSVVAPVTFAAGPVGSAVGSLVSVLPSLLPSVTLVP